eukprot:EST41679.1 hypothetical protein SS50377_18766 [Spironucleus salmonicida]
MIFRVKNHKVTIPAGFIADGVFVENQDFLSSPAWFCFEFLYASHKYDDKIADRGEIDQFMFNNYSDIITVVNDELVIDGVRISGSDIFQESIERGVCVCQDIIREIKINDQKIDWMRICCAGVCLSGIGVGYGISLIIK